ncbi:hypothetical protein EAH88_10920 [Rhodanobacter glycinis]|uniref:Uncharacterized protein n=1 Tax=Rhodanobacter glycinis TaxID=582702 RepID=A0A502C5U3_9GAMM|nr:hypothetical protein [Rhodanobacter glycinis]TPG08162.1 hypothetical protein EAH88_10920 [Rhodanobacter glycinis]
MSNPHPGTAGATRTCPHCRETILESAVVCPACRHKLHFTDATSTTATPASVPLRVEGSFRNPVDSGAWEYSMVLTIRDERGEEIARKLVGVGAMRPDEQRTFTLSVEMNPAVAGDKRSTWH